MLNKFLSIVAILMVISAIAVTAVAVLKKHAVPGEGLERIFDRPEDPSVGKFGAEGEFNWIGKLWIVLKSEKGGRKATLIVSPWLEYEQDRAFYEEMEEKYTQIRKTITDYFSQMTLKEIRARSEDTMKAELMARINSILVLGKIKRIYFNDFQFLEE